MSPRNDESDEPLNDPSEEDINNFKPGQTKPTPPLYDSSEFLMDRVVEIEFSMNRCTTRIQIVLLHSNGV